MNPEIVAYYDTEPSNTNYNQNYAGAWGVYPYLPSGSILASDIQNGLFVLFLDFQLSLCEVDFSLHQKSNKVEINWGISNKECISDLKLQRAGSSLHFEDLAMSSTHNLNRAYTDVLKKPGVYYYRFKWQREGQYQYSKIQSATFSNSCFEFDRASGYIIALCQVDLIRQLRVLNVDGRELLCKQQLTFPYLLQSEEYHGYHILEIMDIEGRIHLQKLWFE
ncbi:MAG: hypothetical protein IPM42_21485 [Saprospiraceae bacterium]|nr:hypothetical protein [Saprospiraceae bacterium]